MNCPVCCQYIRMTDTGPDYCDHQIGPYLVQYWGSGATTVWTKSNVGKPDCICDVDYVLDPEKIERLMVIK